jgi:hypothetical protein
VKLGRVLQNEDQRRVEEEKQRRLNVVSHGNELIVQGETLRRRFSCCLLLLCSKCSFGTDFWK